MAGSGDTFELMQNDHPIVITLGKLAPMFVTCSQLLYVFLALAFLLVIYYTCLLSECREAEADVRKALKKTRRIATAS